MKFSKKLFLLTLSLCLMCTIAFAMTINVGAASASKNIGNGTPRIDTRKLNNAIGQFSDFFGVKRLDIDFVGELKDITEDMYNRSKFDVSLYTGNIPDVIAPARNYFREKNFSVTKLQSLLNERSDKLKADGKITEATLARVISIALGHVEKVRIISVPTDDENICDIVAELTYFDGTTDQIKTGTVYDKNKDELYAKNGKGALNLGYNMVVDELLMYTEVDVWMRELGFCEFYDIAANCMPLFYDYDTVRLKFEYQNEDWLIQVWKGKYYVTNGAEIGVYNKPKNRIIEFYDCADDGDLLKMSIKCSHGDTVLIDRPLQTHWWVNGFSLNDKYYEAEDMTVEASIVARDKEMLNAICDALDEELDVLSYKVKGNTISFVW